MYESNIIDLRELTKYILFETFDCNQQSSGLPVIAQQPPDCLPICQIRHLTIWETFGPGSEHGVPLQR